MILVRPLRYGCTVAAAKEEDLVMYVFCWAYSTTRNIDSRVHSIARQVNSYGLIQAGGVLL